MMGKTANLQLNTFPSSEWGTTKYGDFIKALVGNDATSNVVILDQAIGDLQTAQSAKADLVDGKVPVSQLPSPVKECRVVETITERDAVTDLFSGLRVYVKDAAADPTVTSGGAEYLYDGSAWIKTGEEESLDLVLTWTNITEKPDDFTPSAHAHEQADITGLSNALAGKMDISVYDPNGKAQDIFAYADSLKPRIVSVTLAADGWAHNAQTVAVAGILEDEAKQAITPAPAAASMEAARDSGVYCSAQAADSLTFTCKTVPEGDLTYNILIQEART